MASGSTYQATQYDYERISGRTVVTSQTFSWSDTIHCAESAEGAIARYSLPSRKVKLLLEEWEITNCQIKLGLENEQRIKCCFDKLLHKLKPTKIGDIINAGSWIRKLSIETENQYLPVWMKIQLLREHGGLCPAGIDEKAKI